MQSIKYILVNETSPENAGCALRDCHLPKFRFHRIIDPAGLSHGELLDCLVRLRRHHPDAKILGLSELRPYRVQPSEAMNRLRRELSDLP